MNSFKIAEKLVYVCLMSLGFYFIYQGDGWNNFVNQRSNFAEYNEPISELPTIVVWFQYPHVDEYPNLKLGTDFFLYYWEYPWWSSLSLKEGNNSYQRLTREHKWVPGLRLKVESGEIFAWNRKYNGQKYKFIPLNFPSPSGIAFSGLLNSFFFLIAFSLKTQGLG